MQECPGVLRLRFAEKVSQDMENGFADLLISNQESWDLSIISKVVSFNNNNNYYNLPARERAFLLKYKVALLDGAIKF